MGSADDRRFEVLRAIVADFVATKEPIGSKSLVERHNLGVSSATVRNDMAVLEAEGYIAQPHTSSGGCPPRRATASSSTASTTSSRCPRPERRAILTFLESGVDLDDVLRRAVRLLAQLTRQVAIVQYPTLSASTVRHLEVVALTPARLLLVVITDSGRVDQRIVELGDAIDDHELAQLREMLGGGAGRQAAVGGVGRGGRPGRRSSTGTAGWAMRWAGRRPCWWRRSSSTPRSGCCSAAPPTSPATPPTSAARCVRCSRRWRSRSWCCSCWPLQQEAGKVTVRIGHETESRADAGDIGGQHRLRQLGQVYGGMGVVGPTRMDYPGTIANVAAVALYIGEVLGTR